MYSRWTGKAPNLDSLYGKHHGESVLKPSYFTVAEEYEHMSGGGHSGQSEDDSEVSSEINRERPTFRVEQAHENSSSATPDGLYVISSHSAPSKRGTKRGSKISNRNLV
jgi:outer membrane cobalamin receptor